MRRAYAVLLCLVPLIAAGSELVYVPVNPSFGGQPLNGQYLLNNAQAQDPWSNKGGSGSANQTPLEQFSQLLERAILSRVATALTGSVVNASGQLVPGHVETTDFSIDIVASGGGMLTVTTTDKATGATTSFQVNSNL